MKLILRIAFVLSFLASNIHLEAQITVEIGFENKSESKTAVVSDSVSALRYIASLQLDYFNEGFLTCAVDSIKFGDKHCKAIFARGEQYKWGEIELINIAKVAIVKANLNSSILSSKKISQNRFSKIHKAVLAHYQNFGYPFAVTHFTPTNINEGRIDGRLEVATGPLTKIDSIVVVGSPALSKQYISNYIGVKEGDIYNQSLISKIDTRLRELSFVKVKKNSQLIFTKDATKLYVFLERKKSNQFNGILGVLTDESTREITITGDAKIHLKNALKKGEEIYLNWRKLQSLTQDLDVRTSLPFVFGSPIGLEGKMKVFKKDTSYLELNQRIGLQYLFKGNDKLTLFFDNYSSSLISTDKYENASILPDFADVKFRQYGLALVKEKLDYRFNPSKGFSLVAETSIGNKVISKNPALSEFLYDDVKLKSIQVKANLEASVYIPLAKRNTILLRSRNGLIENENLFVNELFRVGGMRTIRGFDEESVIGSIYSINTFEYRFLLEQNSALYTFFDHGYIEKNLTDDHVSVRLMSVGAGISFQTKAGIFSLNYAVGSQNEGPFLIRSAKIHFGFVNYF